MNILSRFINVSFATLVISRDICSFKINILQSSEFRLNFVISEIRWFEPSNQRVMWLHIHIDAFSQEEINDMKHCYRTIFHGIYQICMQFSRAFRLAPFSRPFPVTLETK